MKKKLTLVSGIFLAVLCLCVTLFHTDIYASEKRTVNVACFPMDGYHITNADGSYGGMDV